MSRGHQTRRTKAQPVQLLLKYQLELETHPTLELPSNGGWSRVRVPDRVKGSFSSLNRRQRQTRQTSRLIPFDWCVIIMVRTTLCA
jgi:hypothetical protein